MQVTTRREAVSRPEDVFIEAVRRAAGNGQVELARGVWDDYVQLEVHKSPDRAVSQTLLVGVRAEVAVRFPLPAARLQEGQTIEIATQCGCGCWLSGPGIDPEDPVDVMDRAFAASGSGPLLAGLVLPEIVERHSFQTLKGWRELTKIYRADRFRYQVGRDSTHVSFIAELEAYR